MSERERLLWVVCPTCEREGARNTHPCRFERACACWYGVPCKPTGASKRDMDRKRAS